MATAQKRVAIMQPTYLPWSGYFGLMLEVDLFIFLDSVQFSRRSWQQRNQIKGSQGAQWLTIPVLSKGKRDQLISDVEIDVSGKYFDKHKLSMANAYAKCPYFDLIAEIVFPFLDHKEKNLAELNIKLITELSKSLNVDTRFVRSSTLYQQGYKADLLASLCAEVGATEYVSPPGSKEYMQKSSAFESYGVKTRFFDYSHPIYKQPHGEFLPFMSVVDMLFNCGLESYQLIRQRINED